MISRLPFVVMLLAIVAAPAAATPRVDHEPYYAGAGVGTLAHFDCEGDTFNLGGACFPVAPGDALVSIRVVDDAVGPVFATFTFYVDGFFLENGRFCGEIRDVPVPAGADSLVVYVGAALTVPDATTCFVGRGSTGSVYAAWS